MVKSMNGIKVTVIIPVYNAEKTLRRCIESVCAQTLKEIEIICVDDGSTDTSAELLRKIAGSDSRIKVLYQENRYAGVARNNGINAAQGRYVTFMDADDVYYSDSVLQALYRTAERHSADMVKGRFCYLDYKSGEQSSDDFSRNSSVDGFIMLNPVFRRRPERFVHAADVPWNGLYRRDFLLQNGIEFNNLVCVNDHSFYIGCLLKARKIRFVRTKTVLYTINRDGSLVSAKPSHFSSQTDSYRIVDAMCREEPADVRRAVMRQELVGVFSLYNRLDSAARDTLRSVFTEFLRCVDEEVIGADFLSSFEWAEQYSLLRYGTEIKRRRLPLIRRAADCCREHGAGYTIRRMLHR